MKEKKPKIKNARLRGIAIMIITAVLAIAVVVVLALIVNSVQFRMGRATDTVLLLGFALFVILLWFIYGLVLLIMGEKRKTPSAFEELKQNEQNESFALPNLDAHDDKSGKQDKT